MEREKEKSQKDSEDNVPKDPKPISIMPIQIQLTQSLEWVNTQTIKPRSSIFK